MKPRDIVRRSLRQYWRSHLSVMVATAVAGTVLIGALLVGGSVRKSLDRLVFLRLGQTRTAVMAGDVFPLADLAPRLQKRLGSATVAVLSMPGLVTVPSSDHRANQIQVCGVDADFQILSPFGAAPSPEAGHAVVGESLARHLAIGTGDEIVLRLESISGMPRDTPLAKTDDTVRPLRLSIDRIVADAEWARFGLQANHTAPLNVFVNREELAEVLGVPGRANLVLSAADVKDVKEELPSVLNGQDASLQLRELSDGGWEVRSPRVFISTGLADEFSRRPRRPVRVLTYLANSIICGQRKTPYSFVTGTDAPWLPKELTDNGIVLNQWLADDLQAKVGDEVRLKYYGLGPMRALIENEATLKVQQIVPLAGPFADPALMPDFPGISDAEDCAGWDTGVRLDFSGIRMKDEDYWDQHRGTPKAFVTLACAQTLWGNRFGDLTAVRFRERNKQDVEEALAAAAKPFSLGLVTTPVWEDGLQASRNAVDFSGLFLGLSFFLIAAALLLTALLYSLALEQRQEQIVTLRSLGWPARQVRRLFLLESLCVAVPGVLLGGLGGVFYNGLVIRALTSIWSGSVGQAPLHPFVSWGALAWGLPITLLVAHLSLRIPLKRVTRGTPREGLGWSSPRKQSVAKPWLAALLVAGGIGIALLTPSGRGKDASASFFGAGSLLLAGLLLGSHVRRCRAPTHRLHRMKMICRGTGRSPGRSLAVEGILACAVFLTVAVGANRHGSQHGAEMRDSGTGGFAFFGETSIPVFEDLNGAEGKEHYGLSEPGLEPFSFVQFSLLPGDEASCLNLNQPQRPRLLGVDPEELDSRHAFRFTGMIPEVDPHHPWLALNEVWDDATVPAIADATVITWALQRKLGQTFTVRAEDGRVVRLRLVAALANSVLQGNLVLGRKALQELYPSISGNRVLLVDAPAEDRAQAGDTLRHALRDLGLELTPCDERLARFSTVENTYLAIFLALGGLALVLGGVGLGVVLVRNVMDRRGELALLRAVGFSHRGLTLQLFAEHLWLFLRGMLMGVVSGLTAVLPAITTAGSNPAFGELAMVLLAVLANAVFWIQIASRRALRTPLIPALRNE